MFVETYTYDDILLVPNKSNVSLSKINLKTSLTNKITINAPLISAAMDTVTESEMAIAMAQQGGIGVIHKNLSIQEQLAEVEKVKRAANGIVLNPVTLKKSSTLKELLKLSDYYSLTSFPVVDEKNQVVGIITSRDIRLEKNFDTSVDKLMSKDLVKVSKEISLAEAREILKKNKIEQLILVDKENHLKGLFCIKDIFNDINYPEASKDKKGRLMVGAACGVSDNELIRAKNLIQIGVDVLVVDTAHGHHNLVADMVKKIKKISNQVSIIAGNVVTPEGCLDLIKAGANGVKVGVGPGSICTTRIVTGVGYPQASAIKNCYQVAKKHKIPIIADGGIKYSGDIAKALALGASTVMIGSLFSGTKEAPGEEFLYNGVLHKSYRGMGSIGAMQKGSKDRYFQEDKKKSDKLVPEGVEAAVPIKGIVKDVFYQLIGGLKSSMGYVGVDNLKSFKSKSKFIKITSAGYQESHVHNVLMTKESPNYKTDKN